MIGFQFPSTLAYEPEADCQKAWNRELLLRVLKAADKRRASYAQIAFEEKIADWLSNRSGINALNRPKFNLPEMVKSFDITGFLTSEY